MGEAGPECKAVVDDVLLFSISSGLNADSFKIQYMQFMTYMKTPQYKANLQQLLEQEKVRRQTSFQQLCRIFLLSLTREFF